MTNTAVRYLTAIVAIPMVVCIIWYAPAWLFSAFISILFLTALYEWVRIIDITTRSNMLIPALTAAVILFAAMYLGLALHTGLLLPLAGLLGIVIICLTTIVRAELHAVQPNEAQPLPLLQHRMYAMSAVTMAVGIIVFSGGSLMACRMVFERDPGSKIILLLLSIVWSGDAGAMHIGKLAGHHRLSPVISPKKTIEGLLGAVCVGILGGVLASFIMQIPVPVWQTLLIAPLLVFLSHTGDLTKSIFKRSASIKDSGRIIPGHGGLLDRLDNLFLTAPAMLIVCRTIWSVYL